jgi:hypothetical protein
MYDMVHDVLGDILRNQICDDVSFQFVRSKDTEIGMQGVINLTFPTTKLATEYIPYIQSIRPELNVEQAPAADLATTMVSKWRSERETASPTSDSMLIVKNLDPTTATIDKLAAIFPDADDIVIASQPELGCQGKLKGRKYAYLIYKTAEDAAANLESFLANPVMLDDYPIHVLKYCPPPSHIPPGYLPLSTRKLVLRHIAYLKGSVVRAQEDPLMEVKSEVNEFLERANECIEKDDAARDSLKLPKPTLIEFKDMTNVKNLPHSQSEHILFDMRLSDRIPSNNRKRVAVESLNKTGFNKKPMMGGGVRPLMSNRGGFSGGPAAMGRARFGSGFGNTNTVGMLRSQLGYTATGIRSAVAPTPRMALIRAAARAAAMLSNQRYGGGYGGGMW